MPKSLNLLFKNLEYLSDKNRIELPHHKLDKYKHGESKISTEKLLKFSEKSAYPIDSLLFSDIQVLEKHEKSSIKFLVLDCDGVLTDASMNLTEFGDEFKRFNAKDGMAIKSCQRQGIQVGIISNGSRSKSILERAKMLGIEKVYVGKESKMLILNKWLEELNFKIHEVAYIGDDLNDIPVMKEVAFSACPADAAKDVKKISHVCLQQKGGNACVREFIEKYLVESLTD